MNGEQILTRSLSRGAIPDKFGNLWQYHSRSDRHSKIACWAVLFDLMQTCPLLRSHIAAGKVGFGINHEMADFVTGRHKYLDLVVCIPRDEPTPGARTFSALVSQYDIDLSSAEADVLKVLPSFRCTAVGEVLVALEAKACMTAHIKAAPRLFDELASASQCINGSTPSAIAVGYVLVNTSDSFVSSDRNRHRLTDKPLEVTHDSQPDSLQKAVTTARRLTVRGYSSDRGFDAVGVTMVSGVNDGTPFTVAQSPPALAPNDPLNYYRMIQRLAGLYDTRFQNR